MFVYNEKVRMIFAVTIIAILVIGFVGGIVTGFSLRGPSAEALENFQSSLSSSYYFRNASEQLAAERNRWGAESTIAMISIWVVTALITVFGYGFMLIIEMLDEIRGSKLQDDVKTKSEHTDYSLSKLASEVTTDNSASWICKKCGTKNTSNVICCKDCGSFNKK